MAVRELNETTEIKNVTTPMALAPTANSLDAIFVAPTVAADGVSFIQTGRELVTIKNTDGAAAFAFTIKAVVSAVFLNRTGDITYTLQAGETTIPLAIHPVGFKDANNKVLITMADVAIQVSVARIPNQVQ
jgi:hypothetical protein